MPSAPGNPKYQKEYDELAKDLCLLGYKNVELAEYFEVNESTIYDWINREPSFANALKAGRELADIKVVKELKKKAEGYQREDGTWVPGDTGCIVFFLKNRQPDRWKDRREVEVKGDAADTLKDIAEHLKA